MFLALYFLVSLTMMKKLANGLDLMNVFSRAGTVSELLESFDWAGKL